MMFDDRNVVIVGKKNKNIISCVFKQSPTTWIDVHKTVLLSLLLIFFFHDS